MKRAHLLTALAALSAFTVVGCGSDSAPSDPGSAGTSGEAGSTGEDAGASANAGSSANAGGGSAGDSGAGGNASAGAPVGEAGGGVGGAAAGAGGSAGGSAGSGVTDPGTAGDGDIMLGANPAAAPEVTANANVPHGTLYKFSMSSVGSIYTGLDKTLLPANQKAFMREIAVYVPKQYVDGTAAPILVVQDGINADVRTDMMNTLDNLIAAADVGKRVPAMVVIFVANGGGDSKGSERGLEYDTVSDRYARFVQTEVLPAVKANTAIKAAFPKLTFTDDPEGRGLYGCSSGGEAAFTAGWFKPEWFHRIITYSGTFVDLQDDDAAEEKTYPLGSWEYHSKLIPAAERKPLRVFLSASEMDNHYMDAESTHFNWLLANQHMAAALKAKGYHYRYVFAKGAGHCDAKVRKATLPETLRWMWRGYPLK